MAARFSRALGPLRRPPHVSARIPWNRSAAAIAVRADVRPIAWPYAVRYHCDEAIPADAPKVNVIFVGKDGKEKKVVGRVGQNLVGLAHEHEIDLEGACECSLACSTCHVILPEEVYKTLETASDEEEDLLDLAFGLTATSRLGCQVKVTKDFEGKKIILPAATRNFYVDGHKPKPH